MAINCKIPEEVWTSNPCCDYLNLKIFGCEAYALTPKNQHSKLDPQSKKCIFVGYDDVTKGYRLWDPTAYKIVISRDVIFDESSLIKSENVKVDVEQEQVLSKQLVQLENQFLHDSKEQEEVSGENEVIEDEEIQEDVETPQPTPRRSTRERKPPKRYTDFVSSVALFADDGEPSCFQEAIYFAENSKWKMAMK